jgi:hypothetical protein
MGIAFRQALQGVCCKLPLSDVFPLTVESHIAPGIPSKIEKNQVLKASSQSHALRLARPGIRVMTGVSPLSVGENNQDGKTLKQYLLSYRFFFVHSSMRLRACCRFSRELATLKRK